MHSQKETNTKTKKYHRGRLWPHELFGLEQWLSGSATTVYNHVHNMYSLWRANIIRTRDTLKRLQLFRFVYWYIDSIPEGEMKWLLLQRYYRVITANQIYISISFTYFIAILIATLQISVQIILATTADLSIEQKHFSLDMLTQYTYATAETLLHSCIVATCHECDLKCAATNNYNCREVNLKFRDYLCDCLLHL